MFPVNIPTSINIVSTLWINVEITLIQRWKWNKMRRRIFNVAQRWYNVSSVRPWNNVKTTLHNVKTTLHNVTTISPFDELRGRDKSETIHGRNIKISAAELFKIKNGLSIDIMAQLICKRNSVGYTLRSQTDFSLPQVKAVNYDLKALRYFGPKIWNILPNDIKNSRTLRESSKKVKSWIPWNCPSRICENYIYQVGFTNIQDSWKKSRIFNTYIKQMLNSMLILYIYLAFRCILSVIILWIVGCK